MPKISSNSPTGIPVVTQSGPSAKPGAGNPQGGPGRPQGTPNKTSIIKIAQIARWSVAGVSAVTMAQLLSMSPGGIKAIKETPEYKEYEAAIMNGHLTEMDKALAGRVEAIRQEARVAVPAAMRCLVDAVTQRKDLPTALAAAREILKRDPDRILTEQGQEAVAPGVPMELLDAVGAEGNEIAKSLQDKVNKETVQ